MQGNVQTKMAAALVAAARNAHHNTGGLARRILTNSAKGIGQTHSMKPRYKKKEEHAAVSAVVMTA